MTLSKKVEPFEAAASYCHQMHMRVDGVWPQYLGLQTRLAGRMYFSDIIDHRTPWENFEGRPVQTVDLAEQKPENYHDTHNHYQLLLSEVRNYLPGTNAIPVWGDGAAITHGAAAWGGFFSARSDYLRRDQLPNTSPHYKFLPEGTNEHVERDDYDCALTGLEVDVLNGGKPGVPPNKAKHGITVVGFGNPNSHGISIICENFDCAPDLRRGQFETGVYFQSSIHPEYGRAIVGDFEIAQIGIDFRKPVFRWGAMHINGAGSGTGINFNDGKGGEIYAGERWGRNLDEPSGKWLSIRIGEVGLRIVSADGTTELMTITNAIDPTTGQPSDRPTILIGHRDILAELDDLRARIAAPPPAWLDSKTELDQSSNSTAEPETLPFAPSSNRPKISNAKEILNRYREAHAQENLGTIALYFENISVSYSYIPKNACTTLKTSLGVANGSLEADVSPHERERDYVTHSWHPHLNAYRFIALRDPFRRVVSAYLEKIAQPVESFARDVCNSIMRNLRKLAEDEIAQAIVSGESPTFREFIRYLLIRSDERLDGHWRGQCSFFTFEKYHAIMPVEELNQYWGGSPLKRIPLITKNHHSATKGRKIVDAVEELALQQTLADVSGGTIRRAMQEKNVAPSVDLFFEDESVFNGFVTRYADDIAVFAELFPRLATSTCFKRARKHIPMA